MSTNHKQNKRKKSLGKLSFFFAHALLLEERNLLGVATTTAQSAHKGKGTKQKSSNDAHGNGAVLVALQLVVDTAVKDLVTAARLSTTIKSRKSVIEKVASTRVTTGGITLDGIFPRLADFIGITVIHLLSVVVLVVVVLGVTVVVVVLVVRLLLVILLLLVVLLHLVERFSFLAHDARLGLNNGFLEVREAAAAVVLTLEFGIVGRVRAIFVVKGTKVDVLVVLAVGTNVVLLLVFVVCLLLVVIVTTVATIVVVVVVVLLVLSVVLDLFHFCIVRNKTMVRQNAESKMTDGWGK